MVKLTQAAKLLAVSAIIPLSMTVFAGSASALNCVDGTKSNNLTTTWNGTDTFTVKTSNGAPLCSDLTLYGSSYVLTDPTYAGGLFGATGSYPQTLFKSVTVTLSAGSNGTTVVNDRTVPTTVVVPLSPCGNQQVDLYYGPEVTTVGSAGHGGQYLAGNIITPFNQTACVGGKGGGDTTPTPTTTSDTPDVPVTDAAPVATLTDTGTNTVVTTLLAGAFIAAAAFVATRRSKVSK